MATDLRSMFAARDAAMAAPTEAPLTPEEEQELASYRSAAQEKQLASKGDYYKEGAGEIDTSMGRGSDFLSRMGRGFTGTIASVPKGLAELYEGATDGDVRDNVLYEAGEAIEEFGEQADINPEYSEDVAAQIGQGLGSAGGFLLGGGVAGAAFKVGTRAAKIAQYAVPGSMGALSGASEQVEDYRQTTGGEPEAEGQRLRLAALGMAGGATEALPFGRVLGRGFGTINDDILKGIAKASKTGKVGLGDIGKQAGKMGLKGLAEEGSQEAFQEGLRNYVASDIEAYDEERRIFEGVAESARTGGAVGFIMNATLGAMGLRARTKALGLADKTEEYNAEKQTGAAPLRETGATTKDKGKGTKPLRPVPDGVVETEEFITPDVKRKRYGMGGVKLKGEDLTADNSFTAKEIIGSSFTNMLSMKEYSDNSTRGSLSQDVDVAFPASLRRDMEVLAGLPEEEQQKAMDGESASPAANMAAQTAIKINKVQKAVNEAVTEVKDTKLSPTMKAKAAKRRVEKKVKDLGEQIDEAGNINISTKAKPTGEQPTKPVKDDRDQTEVDIDTNLDQLEQAYIGTLSKGTSKVPAATMHTAYDTYNKALKSYAAALTRANEGMTMEQGIETAIAHAKQFGIYHGDQQIDAKQMADEHTESVEKVVDKIERMFPVHTKGKYKGKYRQGGELTFPISEINEYREALKEKGLYAHRVSQKGNEVNAFIGTPKATNKDADPLELFSGGFKPSDKDTVSVDKMIESTMFAGDESFFGQDTEAYTLTEKPTQAATEQAVPKQQTEAGEMISMIMKNSVPALRKMLREAGITVPKGADKYKLATALYRGTTAPTQATEETFFGKEPTTETPPVTEQVQPAWKYRTLYVASDGASEDQFIDFASAPAKKAFDAKIKSFIDMNTFLGQIKPTGIKNRYTKGDVEKGINKSLTADKPLVSTPAYEEEQKGKPPPELRPEDEEFFGGNFPTEAVTPPSKSDTGRLTKEQKKQVEDDAEAMRKEIAALEEDGYPNDFLDAPLPEWAADKRTSFKNVWESIYQQVITQQTVSDRDIDGRLDMAFDGADAFIGTDLVTAYREIPLTSVQDVLDSISDIVPPNTAFGTLIEKLRTLNLETTIRIVAKEEMKSSSGQGYAGGKYNDLNDTITISTAIKDYGPKGLKVFLHEVVHAASVRAVVNNKAYFNEVNQLLNIARRVARERGILDKRNDMLGLHHNQRYGLTNELEFISELLTNKGFQEFLQSIKLTEGVGAKKVGTNLWNKFVATVGRILGFGTNRELSLLSESLNLSEKYLLDQYTKEILPAGYTTSMFEDIMYVAMNLKNRKLAKKLIDYSKTDLSKFATSSKFKADFHKVLSGSETEALIYDNGELVTPPTMSTIDKTKSTQFSTKFKALADKVGLKLYVNWDGTNEGMPTWITEGEPVTSETKGRISLQNKEVVLFANNIPDYQSFKRYMFHEVIGHFSIESMFGEEQYNNFISNLSKNAQWAKEIATIQQEYADTGITLDTITAGKELIATMAETGETPNLMNRVRAWIRHKLRKYGYDKGDITDNDLLAYIAKASKQFKGGTLPQIDFQNPQVMNAFVNNLFKGAVGRSEPSPHLRQDQKTMNTVMDKLLQGQQSIDQLTGGYTKAADTLYQQISNTAIPRMYSALKGLPHKAAYNYVRQIGLGDSSDYDQYASHLWRTLDEVQGEERDALYGYFTTKDAVLPDTWATQKHRDAAAAAKKVIIELGDELVAKGYLDEATHEQTKDKYLHTAYLAFLMDEGKASSIYGGGSKISLQGYLKKKTLEDETAKQALGWIDDPVLMAMQSIAMVGRDVALLRMADAMSYTSNRMTGNLWMTPDIPHIKSVTGEMKSPFDVLQEVSDLRKNVLKQSHPSKRPGLVELYARLEKEARDQIAGYGAANGYDGIENIDMSKYKAVGEGKRNGAMAGKWIKKEIYNDIRASYAAFAAEEPGVVEKLIGQYGALTKVNRFWKNTKTVWNPPTHVRNFIGNFVNLDISTSTNVLKLSKMVSEELGLYLEAIANNKPLAEMPYYWRVADKLGITETTFTAQEARAILNKWKRLHHGGKTQEWIDDLPDHASTRWLKDNMPHMRQGFSKLAELMGDTYQGSETLFKVVKLRDTMERYEKKLGRSIESIEDDGERIALESMAVQDAQKWIFDYSAVPRSVRYLRNAPIGAPFISFAYLALPRMFEASAKHPVKVMKYMTLPYAVGQISALAGAFDDDEDWESVKASLPNYQREKYSVMPMPWKDEYGNPVIWDMGYYVPFSPYVEAARSYTRKFITQEDPDMPMIKPVLDMGILSGPIPDVLTAIKSGNDPFTDRPIIREHGTAMEKMYDGLVYGWSTAAPTFLTDKGWAGKTLDVLADSPENYNPRTGERKESLGRATARLAGFTTGAVNLRDSRATNIRYMESNISRIKAASSKEVKQARAGGASTQELADIRKKHTEKIKLYRTNLQDYREKSQ